MIPIHRIKGGVLSPKKEWQDLLLDGHKNTLMDHQNNCSLAEKKKQDKLDVYISTDEGLFERNM